MTHSTTLGVGDTAPDFELRGIDDIGRSTYRLSDFTDSGKWVFLAFYTFDFNPVCTAGMCALRDAEFFDLYDRLVPLGISGDGIHSHERFASQHDIEYPLLSDTGRDVGERYGILQAECDGMRRVHRRGVFVVDDTRTVRFVTRVDADAPDDIDLNPINDVLRDLLE